MFSIVNIDNFWHLHDFILEELESNLNERVNDFVACFSRQLYEIRCFTQTNPWILIEIYPLRKNVTTYVQLFHHLRSMTFVSLCKKINTDLSYLSSLKPNRIQRIKALKTTAFLFSEEAFCFRSIFLTCCIQFRDCSMTRRFKSNIPDVENRRM